ncbi:MAG TPA: RNA 2',3'-cyclic phosphodiesterase [Tepidisphaeraceae bacterium]|jgi:2'-5' RNA ligase|nr:RNA 2',3'-cyclic phosphodiesterase [Tepidisphaeraceae bacterium]
MRLFVAIELDEPFRNHLIHLQDALRPAAPRASFTKPDNLHLTLKFIGEVEKNKVPPLCDALRAVPQLNEFPLHYTGIDLLPERGPIRILAAAVDGGDKLLTLQSAIEDACATHDIPRENRRFRPHITLARAHNPLPRSIRPNILAASQPAEAAQMPVRQFVLMQSKLSDKGSEYSVLYKIALL